jgi:hypothetical protein
MLGDAEYNRGGLSATVAGGWMRIVGVLVGIAIVVFGYFWVVLNWNYSTGERAGWIQKFSKKGWFCKTWEGEMAMVSMPGAVPEKFYFTV